MRCERPTPRVLLVDDDPGDQELVARVFEEQEIKVDLHAVDDGEAALDLLLREGDYANGAGPDLPDLIILDLNMPKLNGRQVIEQIRKQEELQFIPIVVFTTSARDDDVRNCYELGCNSFITKPTDIEQFTAAIAALTKYWFQLAVIPGACNV